MLQLRISLVITLLLCFGLISNINSQVRTRIFNNGIPTKFFPIQKSVIPQKVIAEPSGFEKLLNSSQTKTENQTEYFDKFAVPVELHLDLLLNAKITEEEGITIFALSVKAQNALNVSMQFDIFKLSPNSLLSIYTDHELTDSITSNENNDQNIWATRVYQGDKLTIVLKLPTKEKPDVSLIVNRVYFGFQKVGGEYFGSPGASGSCNINVLCPEGNGWQNERNSVALINANGGYGTGSLLMNTCNTNIPYFLTANHVYEKAGNPSTWVFQFQYWSSVCTPNSGWTEEIQFNGAVLRARDGGTDFALLQLNQTPPLNSGIQYAGWSRGNAGSAATSIHHPKGDLMKISTKDFDRGNPINAVQWMATPGFTHWAVIFDHGIAQPGSSGAPLFDRNHRVIGQLHGNQFSTCTITSGNNCYCNVINPVTGVTNGGYAEFGRFDLSWTGGGTNATRLSNWLDPTGTNATTTNTTNVSSLFPPTLQLSDIKYCDEGVIKANYPSGSTFYWQVYGNLLIDGTSTTKTTTSNSIYVTGTEGSVYVTATATCGTQQAGLQYESHYRQITGLYPEYVMGDHVSVSVNTYPYDTYYRWYVNNTLVKEGSDAYTYCTCDYELPDERVCGDNTIRVEIETTCNINSSANGYFFKICGYYKTQPNVEMFPNPARNQITLRLKQDNAKQEQAKLKEIRQIKIMDKTGSVKKIVRYPSNTNTIHVDISILPVDIYYVEVTDGKNSERLPLSIMK